MGDARLAHPPPGSGPALIRARFGPAGSSMSVLRPVLAVAACAGAFATLPATPVADAARTRTVALEDIAFTPETARISRGDRVRWVWRDESTPHNVRSRGSRRFKGSGTKTTGSHIVRFTRAGTYRYVCTIHIGMDAKVVVR